MAEEYIILIVEEEWDPSQLTESQWTEAMQAHGAFAKAVADAGAQILGGDALQPPSTAVRIKPAAGGAAAVFTDGLFEDFDRVSRSNAVNVAQGDVDALIRRNFYTNDTCHGKNKLKIRV